MNSLSPRRVPCGGGGVTHCDTNITSPHLDRVIGLRLSWFGILLGWFTHKSGVHLIDAIFLK